MSCKKKKWGQENEEEALKQQKWQPGAFPKVFYEWTKSTRAHLRQADEGSNKVPWQCEWISREMTESQAPNSETASNNLVLSRGKWMWHARTLLEILWHFSQVLWFDFIYPYRKEPTTYCFNSSFALSWDFLSFVLSLLFYIFFIHFHIIFVCTL